MHALLLTVLSIAAQPGTEFTPAAHTREVVPVQHTADCGCNNGGSGGSSEGYVSGGYSYGGDYGGGGYYESGVFGCIRAKKGPMPQTCYAPRYGCYPGNDRYVHRYPAFHDSYYRRPYAYRHSFEYPWHAELHEPTSLWSYNVPMEEDPYFDRDEAPVPPIGARPPAQAVPEGVHSARRISDAPPRSPQSSRQQSPRPLRQPSSDAREVRQGLVQELPSVMTRTASRERGPQPTPAVRPPVVDLAPVLPMSDAAVELAQGSFEEGPSARRMSDLLDR